MRRRVQNKQGETFHSLPLAAATLSAEATPTTTKDIENNPLSQCQVQWQPNQTIAIDLIDPLESWKYSLFPSGLCHAASSGACTWIALIHSAVSCQLTTALSLSLSLLQPT